MSRRKSGQSLVDMKVADSSFWPTVRLRETPLKVIAPAKASAI
jgi:hypothetical protein